VSDWRFETPKGWEIVQPWGSGFALREKSGGLRVIVDCEYKRDEKAWVHVSVSRVDRIPSHEDMRRVKEAFIGDRYAYAVFPPRENYVNIHTKCLHLWALAEGDSRVLPEFSEELPLIGRSI
jgi:hypothetical protein